MKTQRRTTHRSVHPAVAPMPATVCLPSAVAQAQRPATVCVLRWLPANAASRRVNPALMARLA